MARRGDDFDKRSQPEESSSAQRVVQCSACSIMVGYSDAHPYCPICGAKLELSTPNYSGQSDGVVTGRDRFPAYGRAPLIERRRCIRIACRDVRACIQRANSANIIVDVPNISRNGMCFATFEQFRPEARISIATHYTEGGQNIFQDGRIIWTREMEPGMPPEYGVEFSRTHYS